MTDRVRRAAYAALPLLLSLYGTVASAAVSTGQYRAEGTGSYFRFDVGDDGSIATNGEPSRLSKVWDKVKFGADLILKSWSDDPEASDDRVRVEAMSRGGESKRLSIPLLSASGPQNLIAGTRLLQLPWIGGSPPFSVVITGPSGSQSGEWRGDEKRIVAAPLHLDDGPYEVRITDARGHSVLGAFEVSSTRPAVDQHQVDAIPPELRNVMDAAILDRIDDGAWRLEAYERLTAAPDDRGAQVVAERLMHGRSISDLGKLLPSKP